MPHNYHSMKCFLSNINCAVINLKKKFTFAIIYVTFPSSIFSIKIFFFEKGILKG